MRATKTRAGTRPLGITIYVYSHSCFVCFVAWSRFSFVRASVGGWSLCLCTPRPRRTIWGTAVTDERSRKVSKSLEPSWSDRRHTVKSSQQSVCFLYLI